MYPFWYANASENVPATSKHETNQFVSQATKMFQQLEFNSSSIQFGKKCSRNLFIELSLIRHSPLCKATEEIMAFGEFYHAFFFPPTANLSSSSSSYPFLTPPHTPRRFGCVSASDDQSLSAIVRAFPSIARSLSRVWSMLASCCGA